jgi:hypothetical protein
VSVEELPNTIEVGEAERVAVGGGGGTVTVTVALFERLPTFVVQFNVYVVVTTGKTTCEPVVILSVSGRLPLQPPAFVQDVILIAAPLLVPP